MPAAQPQQWLRPAIAGAEPVAPASPSSSDRHAAATSNQVNDRFARPAIHAALISSHDQMPSSDTQKQGAVAYSASGAANNARQG
jgi:hypothetical protein